MTSALIFSLWLPKLDDEDDDEEAATVCTSWLTAFMTWMGILNGSDLSVRIQSTVDMLYWPLRFHAPFRVCQQTFCRLINSQWSERATYIENALDNWRAEGGQPLVTRGRNNCLQQSLKNYPCSEPWPRLLPWTLIACRVLLGRIGFVDV